MGTLGKTTKNALLSFGGTVSDPAWNLPVQYKDRETQYYMSETDRFKKKNLRYASDFFSATAQGLFGPDEPEWVPCKIRLAEVVRPSASIQREFDDYKHLMIEEPCIPYIPQGAKFLCMGAVWLVTNPSNVSNGDGGGIVRRCRATWNHLDYYGNVLSEPLLVETDRASASADDSQQFENQTKGYFNITCQANRWTKELDVNSRLILGRGAYRVTGFSDFLEEFTGETDSVRLVRFTARYEEPNEEIDDMERRVAGGKSFSWRILLSGTPTLKVGMGGSVSAESFRNGQPVESGAEHLVSYLWESSDESVCTVDAEGNLTGEAPGAATVICRLAQNPSVIAEYPLTVTEADAGGRLAFTTEIPEKLGMLQSFTAEAAWFDGGVKTEDPVTFALSGAEKGTCGWETAGNRITVTCYGGSRTKLKLMASCGGEEIFAEIRLAGI